MKVLIRPEAEAEITEAHDYYEAVSEGLGAAFLLAVEACLSSIQRSPEMYVAIHKMSGVGCCADSPTASSTLSNQSAL